jgi:hypothetical protein
MDGPPVILARRVYRTGVQTVELERHRFYVSIVNRTYRSRHEVPRATAERYLARMRQP